MKKIILCSVMVMAVIFTAFGVADSQSAKSRLEQKLRSIIIPKVEFQEASLRDVIRWLYLKSKELDPEKKGVNIMLTLPRGAPMPNIKITISLSNVPLWDTLKLISETTGLEMIIDKYQDDYVVSFFSKQSSACNVETLLSPTEVAHQYELVLMTPKIKGSEASLLPTQKMTVTAGQEGKVEILDNDGRNGTIYKALVTESNNVPSEIITSVVVLDNGRETISSKQTIRLNR